MAVKFEPADLSAKEFARILVNHANLLSDVDARLAGTLRDDVVKELLQHVPPEFLLINDDDGIWMKMKTPRKSRLFQRCCAGAWKRKIRRRSW